MFKNLWAKISQSLVDHLGKVSQVRIQSYFILGEILITGIFFLCIEAANAYLSIWVNGKPYAPTTESIWIFGMVLTHHLVMLGLKKGSESSPFPSLDKKEDDKAKVNIAKYITNETNEEPPCDNTASKNLRDL